MASRLDISVENVTPIQQSELYRIHDRRYVDGVFNGTLTNGHGSFDLDIAKSTLWTVGSLVTAAQEAQKCGVACSPTSGFHHASFDDGGGFCTFNGLVLAALRILDDKAIKKVGILDCDWHFGNGTEDIIAKLELQDCISHWTLGGSKNVIDRFLKGLPCVIKKLDAGLIIYQAGADPHFRDPLGGDFNDEELRERDRIVFTECKRLGIPVVWNLAGGYQRDKDGGIAPVLDIHRATMEECVRAWS